MSVTYITYSQLYRDILDFAPKLPRGIDIIAGVPRSGMIPAAMLATHLHLPLTDIHSLCDGRFPKSGNRLPPLPAKAQYRVLVVDDSIYRGSSLRAVKTCINSSINGLSFTFAAVYRDPGIDVALDVDLYHKNISPQRYFEWNLMQHSELFDAMLDIDGVLCVDSPVFDNDGPEYVAAIENAVPLHLPRVPVGALISCRLERWREQTESWLDRQAVKYGRLVLCDYPSAAERRRNCNYGRYKGEQYRDCGATLFIESSAEQAPVIASVSGKPVICLEDRRVYQ